MTDAVTVEAIEAGRVRISRGNWSMEFDRSAVPGRLAFYRRLMGRDRGRYAEVYRPEVEALEPFARQAGIAIGPPP